MHLMSGPRWAMTILGVTACSVPVLAQAQTLVQTPPAPRIEWRDGKTRLTLDNAYLEISNRLQFRYTHEFPDETAEPLPGTAIPGDSRGSFRIRRARLKLEGWFMQPPASGELPRWSYEVQVNWLGIGDTGAVLEDAALMWTPRGDPRFRVVFGQFKAPMGRQQLTSSTGQQFVDRSLVSDEYSRGREVGVAVQGALFGDRLEYRAGLFNGNGQARSTNDNASFQTNARVMWQPNGADSLAHRVWTGGALYSEADFESTTTPIYAIAVAFERNDFHRTTAANDLRSTVIGVDGVFKFKGFFATVEYYARRRTPEVGAEFDSNGGFVQLGMMLNPARTWEAAFRYGTRDVNDLIGDDDVTEIRGGINYYYRRHRLKFQADVGRTETGREVCVSPRRDHELRLQAQFVF